MGCNVGSSIGYIRKTCKKSRCPMNKEWLDIYFYNDYIVGEMNQSYESWMKLPTKY